MADGIGNLIEPGTRHGPGDFDRCGQALDFGRAPVGSLRPREATEGSNDNGCGEADQDATNQAVVETSACFIDATAVKVMGVGPTRLRQRETSRSAEFGATPPRTAPTTPTLTTPPADCLVSRDCCKHLASLS